MTSETPPILNISSQTDTELERLLNTYEELPTLRFVDIIQSGGEQADQAMYYLVHQRLNSRLKERFVVFKNRLLDDFDDIVDDFLLYLRDGNGDNPVEPYRSFRRIQKKESFEAWMVSTFRNYLSLRAEKEGQMAACINDDFDHLYPTLMRYYGQTLETLNNADAIKHLRQEYYDATCQMLHEPQATYSLTPSIPAFWNNLNSFLIV